MSEDIYSMQRSAIKSSISTFLVDDIGGDNIDHVSKMLAGIPHAADKAIGSAIKRAAQSGEAHAARAVRDEYFVKASDFKAYTKSKRHVSISPGASEIDIEFRGFHIPLLRFDTKVDSSGRVVTRVKRTSSKVVLDHVFPQTVGTHGHIGVFERTTSKRLPIEEKLGPSTPQMMDVNDEVAGSIADKVRETFDKRIEHEVTAILNGYRR